MLKNKAAGAAQQFSLCHSFYDGARAVPARSSNELKSTPDLLEAQPQLNGAAGRDGPRSASKMRALMILLPDRSVSCGDKMREQRGCAAIQPQSQGRTES
jgi:hypothetical protein